MSTYYIEQHFHNDSEETAEQRLVEFMNQFGSEVSLKTVITKKDDVGNDYLVAIFATESSISN
jgi:phosphatidate phosphatase PAH1